MFKIHNNVVTCEGCVKKDHRLVVDKWVCYCGKVTIDRKGFGSVEISEGKCHEDHRSDLKINP